ncbi:MAG TPA: class I SAM-dependent methyltransferase [Solirubrobacteraceae bacterium]|nr:class I SAM-dependent methyltransferase [Solirubrobacteraceae bacterium]
MSHQAPTTSAAGSEVPERFDPATMQGELLESEHLARYRWAARLAHGRRVLDAGCGTAYGSKLLAEAGALEVVGIDMAADVLDSVRAQMPANVVLEVGDVTSLGYADGRFDLVVCFEVIEHLEERGRALDEFRRVLSAGGVLVLSSPNRDVYPPGNPHHVHEYTPDELERELSPRFTHTRLERQHTWITSGVLDDAAFGRSDDEELDVDVRVRKLARDEPGAELYTVALAGQQDLPVTPGVLELATAVELRKWDRLWHEQARAIEQQADVLAANEKVLGEQAELFTAHDRLFAEQAVLEGQLRHEVDELRGQLAKTESELARMPALDAQLKELLKVNDETLAHNQALQERQVGYDDLAARYAVVVQSTSWKLTAPLRRVGAIVRKLTK